MQNDKFVIVGPDDQPVGWDFKAEKVTTDGAVTIFDTEALAYQVLRKIIAIRKYRIEVANFDEVYDE